MSFNEELKQAHLSFLQESPKEILITAIAHSMRAIEILDSPLSFTSLCHESYIIDYQRALFDRFGLNLVEHKRKSHDT